MWVAVGVIVGGNENVGAGLRVGEGVQVRVAVEVKEGVGVGGFPTRRIMLLCGPILPATS